MRWPRQVVSLLFVLLLLVGPPVVLVFVVGSPVDGWPNGRQVRAWIEQPLTEQTLIVALTVGAWLVWLVLTYTVAVTASRRLRAGARWLRRLPLPTPWQAAATSMAGAAALTTAHTPTTPPPALPAPVSVDGLHPHTPDMVQHAGEGVAVPGGWLPDDTAQQVTAAAALVWLRRRRDHQPGHPATDTSRLTPLPATVTAVQAAVADRQPPAATPTGGAALDLPTGGVVFTGDGAADAARGVLVTRLLTALRDPPDTTRVLVTRAALTTLLPDIAATADTIPGLRVVDAVERAAALLSSLPARPARPDSGAGSPSLVLVTDPPSAAMADGLAALPAGQGRIVTLGASALGHTWHVDRHGHTRDGQTGQPGPRLCVLDRTAATDLLTVLTYPNPAAHDDTATDDTPPRPADRGHTRIPRQPRRRTPYPARQPSATAHPVRLRVLGRPALLVDGQPVTIRRNAALQVLVFLAVHPDGATTANLVHAIWPGVPAHTVTGRLYTTLSDLRATIRAATSVAVVGHTDDRYHLDHEHIDVDLWRLHTAHHATTTHTNPAGWQAVIDAYTGDLAAGHTWPWIDLPRETTRRLVLDAYTNAAAAHTNPHHRLRLLQDALRVDPYNQALHHLTAEHLTALGDPAAANQLLHTHRQLLHHAGIPASDPPVAASR